MVKHAAVTIAILLSISSGLQAEEKSVAQQSAEWYLDANGNPDSCKAGAPSPDMRLQAEEHAAIEKEIEACHKRKAANAEAGVKRRENEAAQQAGERSAAMHKAEAHKRYLEDHLLTSVTVVDLQANGRNMVGEHVAVKGYIRILSEDVIDIYSSTNDVNGVRLDLTGASPRSRRQIFGLCSDIYHPCMIEIAGTVAVDDHVLVQVE